MSFKIFCNAVLMCLVIGGLGSGPAGADLIDGFDDPVDGQFGTFFNGSPGSSLMTTAISLAVPGGSRALTLEVLDALPGGNTVQAAVNTLTTPSTYQLAQSVLVQSFGVITYDALGVGLNYSLAGFAGLRLTGVVNDFLTPFTLTLETFGAGGGKSSTTASILTGDLNLLFSNLVPVVGTVNLNDIDRISIRLDPPRGGDVKIDGIETTAIPLPATLLLFGSGLFGLVGFGKKKLRR